MDLHSKYTLVYNNPTEKRKVGAPLARVAMEGSSVLPVVNNSLRWVFYFINLSVFVAALKKAVFMQTDSSSRLMSKATITALTLYSFSINT